MNFIKKLSRSTIAKYFFSYFIIFFVMILGFFFILKKQVINRYFEQKCIQVEKQLDSVANYLNSELTYLSQVNASLTKNITFIMANHKNEASYRYHAWQMLDQYASTVQLANDIIYLPQKYNAAFSTYYHVSFDEGIFQIVDASGATLFFDPSPYYNVSYGQLISITSESSIFLLYLPPSSPNNGSLVFFIIDTNELYQQFKQHTTNEIISIALVDADKNYIIGTNPLPLVSCIESIEIQEGIYTVDSSTSLCINTDIQSGFSLLCLISNDFLSKQINDAFSAIYLALIFVGIIGFLLIYFSMKITYVPLHNLTRKLVLNSDSKQEYLNQIEAVFSQTDQEVKTLEYKLDTYRLSMQKALLSSAIVSRCSNNEISESNIDTFFDLHNNKEIFFIKVASPNKRFPAHIIKNYFLTMLPLGVSCIIWEATEDYAIFLINYTGTDLNKSKVLKEILDNLYYKEEYLCAISNSTVSPMDIPELLTNTLYASSYWPNIPVVEYTSLPPISSSPEYPYDKLTLLAKLLKENDFSTVRTLIDELLQTVNHSFFDSKIFPDFFIRCILIDITTTIISVINRSKINFSSYKELYFETLYYCRSFQYCEKKDKIYTNLIKLIDYYEDTITNTRINALQIKTVMTNNYCNSDFSISELANAFHVSISYMSNLFKKELNENFSDYLWKLRMTKAKQLLEDTDKSVDEISVIIGYDNPSSFRRKFKQETGLSPSQYRTAAALKETSLQEE